MELISEPAVVQEPVTDIDIVFLGGVGKALTLREDDSYEIGTDFIHISIAKPLESIVIERRNVLWFSTRSRVINRIVKPAKSTASPV